MISILPRLVAAAAGVILVSSTFAAPLPLVERKDSRPRVKAQSAYSIYFDAGAPSSVKLAAEEIQRAVEISTGVRLPIAKQPAVPMICLGENAAARQAGFSAEVLPDEGFRIVTKGGNLYILGKDTKDGYRWRGYESRGTLFGAYEFLEQVVGVRWLIPGDAGEEIPAHKILRVPDMDVTQSPDFTARELVDIQNQVRPTNPKDFGPPKVDRWLLRQKAPNISDAVKSTRRKVEWGHSWRHFVTRDDLKAHPEWQAVSGGGGKFCTSNREAVEHFALGVIKWLDEHHRDRSARISPEDGGNFCKCPKCKAGIVKDWHGNVSYTPVILKFYNDVAKIVGRKHPDRILGGLIYYNYVYPPPKPIKIEPNVHLVMAPLPYYGWGLAKPVLRDEFRKLITAWTKLTANFGYFNWSVWFRSLNGTPLPPGRPILKLELPTLHACGVKGVGMVGIGAWGYGGCENYILTKLLWDAESDVDALYREWMQKAYGPAWKTMDRFVTMIEDCVLERKRNESPRYSGDNYEVNYDFVEQVYKPAFPKMERLYLEAMGKVATAKQKRRLEMLGDNMVMLHYNMQKADMLKDPEKSVFYRTDTAYRKFLDDTVFALSLYRDHGHRDVPLLFEGSFSGQAENPPMEMRNVTIARVPAGTAPPVLDGDLSDAAWKAAITTGDFRKVGTRDSVKRQTEAQLLYDRNNLYISFVCNVVDPAKVSRAVTERDGNVFRDDCVEVLLAVFPNARRKFWHLALSAGNAKWDGIGKGVRHNLAWKSAVGTSKNGWTAEIAIPFDSLGMKEPPAGKTWSANLTRTERSPDGGVIFSSWNAVYRGFQEPYSFGEWTFAP